VRCWVTDTHPDTQTKYCNPCCACVPRVNYRFIPLTTWDQSCMISSIIISSYQYKSKGLWFVCSVLLLFPLSPPLPSLLPLWPEFPAPTTSHVYIYISITHNPYSGLFLWGANFCYFHGSKFFAHCVVLSTCAQIWTSNVLLWVISLLVPHWQYPWYTGFLFLSCPKCDGWGSEQSSVESRSTTSRKQDQ